jgi:hypothetical protein
MYCLNMLAIAMELAREDHTYGDMASKFFEHFVYIADVVESQETALKDVHAFGIFAVDPPREIEQQFLKCSR